MEKIHGCLEAQTEITLADGNKKPISQIKPGEFVLSLNESNGEIVPQKVESVICRSPIETQNWLKLSFDNGQELICTEDHLIFTGNRGWVPANQLVYEDSLISKN